MEMTKAEVLATGKHRLVGWAQVPDQYKTKTQWGKEGMKLREDAEPAAYVYVKGPNEHFELYLQEAVEPKQKQRPAIALALTPENIGAALYEINKAAKRRRDSARNAYENRRHAMASTRKAEKEAFYQLKDDVIDKAAEMGIAKIVGYHSKHHDHTTREWIEDQDGDAEEVVVEYEEDEYGDRHDDFLCDAPSGHWGTVKERRTTYLECHEIGGFRFHRIVDQLPTQATTQIEDLGTWESAATARPKHMPLKDAEATLHAFVQSSGEALTLKQ